MKPIHFSNLKYMAQSPAHFLCSLGEQEDTSAMRLGRLVHALLLGGKYEVYDGVRRGVNWVTFKYEHRKIDTIVNPTELAQGKRIAESVRHNSSAMEWLEGEHEVPVEWKFLGRECSSRIDILGNDRIVDLKTTQCSRPETFIPHAMGYYYHAQVAFYRMAALAIPKLVPGAGLIAVETGAPYNVVCYDVPLHMLEVGERLCNGWMETLLECERTNHWPGYTDLPVMFDPVRAL
jgi:hypothetical protein